MTAIGLTVIGGFLGAGKTTMINHLLRHATGRMAVLVNDFGAVNIDAALIAEGNSVALSDGCICCSLGDDFTAALEMLAARDPAPEHVIVEASGVSDPWRIAQIGLTEPAFSLEPLVVLADAGALPGQLADPWLSDTIMRQLQFAELIVLNKCDTAGDLPGARAALRERRPEAPVIEAMHGEVEAASLRFPTPLRLRASRLQADACHDFRAEFWRCPGPLDRARLRSALEVLPRSVLRVKGFCEFGSERSPHLLQYAAERWAFTPAEPPAAPGFVVIGTPDMPDAAPLFESALLDRR